MTPNDRVDTPASLSAAIIERAKSRRLNLPELIQAAETIAGADAARHRVELYKTWIAFNADHPLAHLAYFNYSVSLARTGRPRRRDQRAAGHAARALQISRPPASISGARSRTGATSRLRSANGANSPRAARR